MASGFNDGVLIVCIANANCYNTRWVGIMLVWWVCVESKQLQFGLVRDAAHLCGASDDEIVSRGDVVGRLLWYGFLASASSNWQYETIGTSGVRGNSIVGAVDRYGCFYNTDRTKLYKSGR